MSIPSGRSWADTERKLNLVSDGYRFADDVDFQQTEGRSWPGQANVYFKLVAVNLPFVLQTDSSSTYSRSRCTADGKPENLTVSSGSGRELQTSNFIAVKLPLGFRFP